ncbi:hypothetical protein [Streptomonospora salina]|uniref:Uncharacterized protein n=1 Tax=Streptomonospora salina TaxID=104205 RepID=A0A841ECM6_9ACTN|nr:hypothetical protein [Streptomonospora salina]MBB6000862.1 hypothetical protein [Streptomonospora salina]
MTHPLDRDGEWELRMSIYRNGRRVGFCDVRASSYDALVYDAESVLSRDDEITFTGRDARYTGTARTTTEETPVD